MDIGQGSKTILRQIAADELGVPLEAITVNNFDTDIGPMCTGTFASRVTFMDGNAVIRASADFKKKIREWAAEAMEANPEDIEMADNKVFVKGVPAKAKTMAEVGGAVNWGGQYIVGTGAFIPGAGQGFDPATGKDDGHRVLRLRRLRGGSGSGHGDRGGGRPEIRPGL